MESQAPHDDMGTAPRRHGRRARPLSEEERAEMEARRAELEAAGVLPGSGADEGRQDQGQDEGQGGRSFAPRSSSAASSGSSAAPAADQSSGQNDSGQNGSGQNGSTQHGSGQRSDSSEAPAVAGAASEEKDGAPMVPAEPQAPRVRRLGRRARVVEVDESSAALTGAGSDDAIDPSTRDADGVELGELTVTDAPDPLPAPRFEGRVLQRQDATGGSPMLWIVWILVALAIIAVIVLIMTGVLGTSSTSALGSSGVAQTVAAAFPSSSTTTEVLVA